MKPDLLERDLVRGAWLLLAALLAAAVVSGCALYHGEGPQRTELKVLYWE